MIKKKAAKPAKKDQPKQPQEQNKPRALNFKEEILKSSIINRVSPSTLTTIFCVSDNKDEIIKAIIAQLANSITACEPKEFKQITSDLNKLID